ncbi:hypothetical protein GCM10011344_11060 [Dokdonia pacifica]|uniref:Uncharacterized protein n=1 Tax=Dokdonia pacifica TaxID=1627892 RepID=A0A238YJJ3_9FLAO|nr:hypothetical protein [Dokdonia pacifica]GGG12167.1 hypothetical protein GCM10011344_11060 [Dokdonia pacifica]SNR70783.1 hypothetical protein SAMN06265376_10290 [Dokdonia pacifica]
MNSELEDKIQELESDTKKRNYLKYIMALILLGVFVSLFFLAEMAEKKVEKVEEIVKSNNKGAIDEKKKEKEILQEKEQKDSLIQFTSEVYVNELKDIREKLVDRSTYANRDIISSIDSILNIAKQVSRLSSDTIPFRFYRRPNDSKKILEIVKASTTPFYKIDSIYEGIGDTDKQANTIHYGSLVKKAYVDELVAKLREQNIPIELVQQFKGKRGYDWKKVTVQIEYTDTDTVSDNSKWNIQFYSYKPNKKVKYIARKQLMEEGYNVEFFPDWERKMSFFSEYPVVIFYKSENETKAKEIAAALKRDTGVNFVTESGDGLGVSDAEKDKLFIVHYNGANK